MMGSRLQTTAMFQYFCLDDWVPADHLLRGVDRHVDFRAIRERLRPLYSDIGRPSIDPEVLAHRLSLWHHERASIVGRSGTKPRVSLVHGSRLRSVDS